MSSPWLMLQLADAAFPAGGFAHSAGLEALFQQGEVRDTARFREVLSEALWQVGHASIPFVSAAYANPDSIVDLDARYGALVVGHVVTRASRTQGRALLDTACKIFPSPSLDALSSLAKSKRISPHLPPVFGVLARAVGLDVGDARRVFLYQSARGFLSAAVRLGMLGPHESQAIQASSTGLLDSIDSGCAALAIDDARQTAPLLDLFANTHDRLYSRLFLS